MRRIIVDAAVQCESSYSDVKAPIVPDADQQIAIAVVIQGEHVLVGRRAAEQVLGGKHEFPGGKVHTGETPEMAAVRECQEETGLEVQIVGLIETVQHTYAHGRLELSFLHCRCGAVGLPQASEPFEWVRIDELPQLNFPAANASVLKWLATGPKYE